MKVQTTPAAVASQKSIPTFVTGTEKKAFEALFADAKDGKIDAREAKQFASQFHDLFEKGSGDHRWLRYAVQELAHPGTTYAYSWTPDAKLTAGAQKTLDTLNGGQNWWMNAE